MPGLCKGFPGGSEGKASAHNTGDLGSIPGSGRSPGEGNGNPLQYSCLGNPMDREAWWATVHGVAKSQAWLRDLTFTKIVISKIEREKLLSSARLSATPWTICSLPGFYVHGINNNNHYHVLSTSNGAKHSTYIISCSSCNSPMRDFRLNHMVLLILKVIKNQTLAV